MKKNKIFNFLIILISIIITFFLLEFFLVIKSKLIINYDTEMWKYSKYLKIKNNNPKINHTHKKNSVKNLQNVEIEINNLGLRGSNNDLNEWKLSKKKFLILGSSITLGWGVDKNKILTSNLDKLSKENNLDWKFLNAGVGNYNTERYVNNYFENLTSLKPDTIIVQYFLNDAEDLPNTSGNLFTRNSQLAVMIWKYINIKSDNIKFKNIFEYYKEVYSEQNLKKVKDNLSKLKDHCTKSNKKCLIVYTPDIQFLKDKKYDDFEEKIKEMSQKLNFSFISLTAKLRENQNKKLLNDYNDNHPNELGHFIMSETIFNYLK